MLGFKRKCKYYDSIHNLPMLVYNNICKTHDYSLLVYEGKYKGDITDVWAGIYDEDEEEFGSNKKYNDWIKLKIKEYSLLKSCYIDGNRTDKVFATVKEADAQFLIDSLSTYSFKNTLKYVSKEIGGVIDLRTITVYTFKSYVYGKI